MLAPQLGDLFVGLVEIRDRRAPVTEDRFNLSMCAAFAWNREYLTHALGERIGDGVGRGRDRKPHPPQVVVLIVVAVPSAVVLLQIKSQNRSASFEIGFSATKTALRSVCAVRGLRQFPCGFVLAVDREFDGAGHATAFALVVVDRLELALWLVVIGGGGLALSS